MELFATCGLGLELFVKSELEQKFNITPQVAEFTGKIFFSTSQDNVKNLVDKIKSIERLFALVLIEPARTLKENNVKWRNKKDILSYLYNKISNNDKLTSLFNSIENTRNEILEIQTLRDEPKDEDDGEIDPKRTKNSISFRVSVKISGKYSRMLDQNEVGKSIGTAVVKKMTTFGWTISTKNPNFDITVYLTNEGLLIGIPLTSLPISGRHYLQHIPMRSTIAFAMGNLLNSQSQLVSSETQQLINSEAQQLICDPMCGGGTILIELLKENPIFVGFGFDICNLQLEKAKENLLKSQLEDRVHLIQCDVTTKVFKCDFMFDAILCDIPFGRKHSIVEIKKLLIAFNSLVKVDSSIILLLATFLTQSLEQSVTENNLKWEIVNKYPIKLGLLQSTIYHYKKNV